MKDKLKTLKDIEIPNDYSLGEYVYSSTLKAEAIKWVKEVKSGEIDLGGNRIRNPDMERAIKEWIKLFFNLTEEDLK